MSTIEKLERMWRAEAVDNSDFICVETWSGYGSSRRDPIGVQHLLKPGISDQELGEAALDALSKSRFVLPEEDMELYDYKMGQARYQAWVADLMARYGYKTKRALFKRMKSCGLEIRTGILKISPTHHEKLESWGREKDDGIEDVTLPADSPPAEIGAALRLAFSRCT